MTAQRGDSERPTAPLPPGRTRPASPQPGNRDEREAEIVRRWMRPDSHVPEGRCSATECWYTLPLNAQGLVVQHSQSGTVSTCEGGGRPPREPAPPPAPSAGQDTEQLRDEAARLAANIAGLPADHRLDVGADLIRESLVRLIAERDEALALSRSLASEFAHVAAERDEARAQVQRVRELADYLEVEGRESDGSKWHDGYTDAQANTAYRVRRALDGPQHGDRPC